MCSCHVVNEPKNTDDPVTNKLRKAFVHRALWMGLILKELKDLEVEGKPAAAFGSYGWSGEAVEVVEDYLRAADLRTLRSSDIIKSTGMSDIEFPLRVRFNPENSEKEIKKAAAVFIDVLRY